MSLLRYFRRSTTSQPSQRVESTLGTLAFRKKKRRNSKRLGRRLLLESLEVRKLMVAEIFGTVYSDIDQTGSKTPGDEGLAGWSVYLDTNKDGQLTAGEPVTTTNVDGDYLFAGVTPGSYRVAEVVQAGWTPTSLVSKDVTVEAGRTERVDFFVFAGGDISGVVWSDLDHDGSRTVDPTTGDFIDPALSGWTIFLDGNANNVLDTGEPTRTTDADGRFRFENLPSGDYEVAEILPAGWEATRKHDIRQTATVVELQTTDIEFGNFTDAFGGIRGTVFNDINADGERNRDPVTGEFSEPGISGWTVYLDLNSNSTLDDTDISAVTDTDGEYLFLGLSVGLYDIIEEVPEGWVPSPGTISNQTVNVVAGDTTVASDFANFTVANGGITGLIWNDLNRNGVRDFNSLTGVYTDPTLAGWQVFVDLNRNRILDAGEPTTTTNATGSYAFSDLQVGDYEVQEILPAGWETAPTHDAWQTVTVFSGVISSAADFANFNSSSAGPGSVSGLVWNDVDGDGVRLASESPLEGWTVFLDANRNGAADSGEPQAVTPADGSYTFTGLSAGTVTIVVAPMVGWRATAPASNARTITLRGGENATGLNFGEAILKESSISGTVFADMNKNGVRDTGERGLSGIAVYIDANDNGTLDPTEQSIGTSEDLYYTPDVDEAGSYRFDHLGIGNYVVRAIVPELLSATPASELVHTLVLGTFENRTGIDTAAVFRPTEVRGYRYDDQNGNHVRDLGEPPIVGATVYVDLNRNDAPDVDEPRTTTGDDGSYVFTGLSKGSYVVRSVALSGYSKSYPMTTGGILWPSGSSNQAVGNVTPTLIEASLLSGQSLSKTVSITLPNTGALTNMVDVFLLFDDTGSFVSNSPIVRGAFPEIINQLQTALPGTNLGFGVGRFEEYGNFAFEYDVGRPFILNQPIVASSTAGSMAAIQAALDRTTPGYGGDGPETDIEALYQLVTGKGFDGNNNGSVGDSGAAGLGSTQLSPGNSGDVPSFASFTPDPSNSVLPAAGSVGGGGFRAGALPIILLATDIGVAYQPKGESSVNGVGGLSLPISELTQDSRPTTPFNSGAGIQETITGLNALGALVIGLGTNADSNLDPRKQLEAISKLTGATNQTTTTIDNGTVDPIAPGDPLYFEIATGFSTSVSNGVISAIKNAATNVAVDIEVRASDSRVRIVNHTGVVHGVGSAMTATFDVEFVGDGAPHRFDLQFVRAGTNVVLGSIPVVLGTPIMGDNYHYDELEDGEFEIDDDFGDTSSGSTPVNNAPSFLVGPNITSAEDTGAFEFVNWATLINAGSPSESGQSLTFQVANDNPSLFVSAPSVSPTGTLTFAQSANANGATIVTVRLKDNGGTANGGVDTSAPQTFTITLTPVNDAPFSTGTLPDLTVRQNASASVIHLTGLFDDIDDVSLQLDASSSDSGLVQTSVTGTELELTFTPGASGVATITLTATDSGGLSASSTFAVTILPNAMPTLSVSNPIDGYAGVAGQLRTLQLNATDTENNAGRPFQYEVDWGDGSPIEAYLGPMTFEVSHTYSTVGNANAQFRTIDPDGGASDWVAAVLPVLAMEVQADRLVVGATPANDSLIIAPSSDARTASITLNGAAIGIFAVPANGIQFFGGLGNDSIQLRGTAGDDAIAIDGNAMVWGGSPLAPDPIAIQANDIESVSVDGQAGNDAIHLLSGTASVIGGLGIDTLSGPASSNQWMLTGVGIGTLNGLGFNGIEALNGGADSDVFKLTNAGRVTGAIHGGSGVDQLDYSARTTAVSVNWNTLVATGMAGMSGFESILGGTAANDAVTGANASNQWDIHADGTTLLNSVISIQGFETLNGGTGVDRFVLAADVLSTPALNGGSGSDALSFINQTNPVTVNRATKSATGVPSFNAIENFEGGTGADVLIGANQSTTWTLSDAQSGTFSGGAFSSFESILGGSGNDTFTMLSTTSPSVDGGTGTDTLRAANASNTWDLSGIQQISLNGQAFLGIENVTGGTGTDSFFIQPSATGFGVVSGGSGVDSLNYTAWTGPITVDLLLKKSPSLTAFSSIESVVGTASSDTLVGTNANTTWSVSGPGSGTASSVSFQSFEHLVGGAGIDKFRILGGSVESVLGGLGTDSLQGDNVHSQWSIDGAGSGVLNSSLVFAELESLIGGTRDDDFVMQPTGALTGSLSGGAGINSLSYAAWTTDVAINQVPGTATGIATLAANVQVLIGGSGNDVLTAFATLPSVVIGNGGNDTLTGSTNGRDLLFGGTGSDALNGLGGDDILFGGQSGYDASINVLKELHAEWKSARTYRQRVDNLRGGPVTGVPLNGSNLLSNSPSDTLLDDGTADSLFGGTGTDWFIQGLDDVMADLAAGELVDWS